MIAISRPLLRILACVLLMPLVPASASGARGFDFFAFDPHSSCLDLFGEPRSIPDRLFDAYIKSLDGYRSAVSPEEFIHAVEQAIRTGRSYEFPRDSGGQFAALITKIEGAREPATAAEFDTRVRRHLKEALIEVKAVARTTERSVEKTKEILSIEKNLIGHRDVPADVHLNADGSRAISVSVDGKIIVWNLESGKPERSMDGRVGFLRVNSDFTRVLGVSPKKRIILWDIASGEKLKTLRISEDIERLETSADFKTLFTKTLTGKVQVWDFDTGKKVREILAADPKKSEILNSLTLSADLKRVATRCRDQKLGSGWIDVWNLETGEKLFTSKDSGYSTSIEVQFDADLTRAMTLSDAIPLSTDRLLIGWDLVSGKVIWEEAVSTNNTLLRPARHSKPWGMLFEKGLVTFRDLNTGKILFSLDRTPHLPAAFPETFRLNEVSGKLFVLYHDGVFLLWDLETHREMARYATEITGLTRAIETSSDFRRAVVRTGIRHEMISYDLGVLETMQ